MRARLQPHEGEQARGLRAAVGVVAPERRPVDDVLPRRNSAVDVKARHDVVERGELLEQADLLERARDARGARADARAGR